jgi:hypothetical protein
MDGFAKYVSAVPGRLASRPGSPHSYIGARLTTAEERKKDPAPAVWDEKQIVAVTHDEYLREPLSWMKLVRNSDVLERTKTDFKAYTEALAASEKKRDEQLAAAAKKPEPEAKKKPDEEPKPAAGNKPTGGVGGAAQ